MRLIVLGGVMLGLLVARADLNSIDFGGIASAVDARMTDNAGPRDRDHRNVGGTARTFGLCFTGGGTNCVVDGDTVWIDGEKVRVADIDTPETHPPRCDEEARLGEAATLRMQALLNDGPVTLVAIDRDLDRYGRKLRVVERGGVSLGETLVREGLRGAGSATASRGAARRCSFVQEAAATASSCAKGHKSRTLIADARAHLTSPPPDRLGARRRSRG